MFCLDCVSVYPGGIVVKTLTWTLKMGAFSWKEFALK